MRRRAGGLCRYTTQPAIPHTAAPPLLLCTPLPPSPPPHLPSPPPPPPLPQVEVKGRLAQPKVDHFLSELRHSRSRTVTLGLLGPAPDCGPQERAELREVGWLPAAACC